MLVAPYDIRQGMFTGGLVNAVTKSGTNKFSGSLFAYFQNEDLVGKDTAGLKVTTFQQPQYGGTFGGPIIKDKLHFFVAADLQRPGRALLRSRGVGAADRHHRGDRRPGDGGRSGQVRVRPRHLRPAGVSEPNNNVFGKLTGTLGTSHRSSSSYNYVDGFKRRLQPDQPDPERPGWLAALQQRLCPGDKTNPLRGKWMGQFG